jgi:DNA-binding NtrC family response regulator
MGRGNTLEAAAYLLGRATHRFRQVLEANYLLADPIPHDPPSIRVPGPDVQPQNLRPGPSRPEAPPIPVPVTDVLRQVQQVAREVGARTTTLAAVIDRLIESVNHVYATFEDRWYSAAHRELIDQAHNLDDPVANWDFRRRADAIEASDWPTTNWARLRGRLDEVRDSLPSGPRCWFTAGRLLAWVAVPIDAEIREVAGGESTDWHAAVAARATEVEDLLRTIRAAAGTQLLVPVRFDGAVPSASAVVMDQALQLFLESWTGSSASSLVTAGTPTTPRPRPASTAEEYGQLLESKRRIDPQSEYVGESVAILQAIRDLEGVSRSNRQPVVIYGPSGVGKTELARLLHQRSVGNQRPFRSTSGNQEDGADFAMARVRWLGVGRKHGLPDFGKDPVIGLLQEAHGGTIFIDEAQDLPKTVQGLLRQVLDPNTPFSPAAGKGDEYQVDVRLVFALNRPIEELVKEGMFLHDFANRIRNHVVAIPTLNDRREDIPLFVLRFLPDSPPDPDFLWVLLRHDWRDGEVRRLVSCLRRVAQDHVQGNALNAELLRRDFPDLVDEAAQHSAERLRTEVLDALIVALREQGFTERARGRAINKRLAYLLDRSESTISRWRDMAAEQPPTPH